MLCGKIKSPSRVLFYNEKVIIGAKAKEFEYKVEARGAYEMCFEFYGG
jgi:hypothetical protein